MQRFPDHSAQPSAERVTYANHRRTGACLRLPMSASEPTPDTRASREILPEPVIPASSREPAGCGGVGKARTTAICSHAALRPFLDFKRRARFGASRTRVLARSRLSRYFGCDLMRSIDGLIGESHPRRIGAREVD